MQSRDDLRKEMIERVEGKHNKTRSRRKRK